jgi:hypothetical protein
VELQRAVDRDKRSQRSQVFMRSQKTRANHRRTRIWYMMIRSEVVVNANQPPASFICDHDDGVMVIGRKYRSLIGFYYQFSVHTGT